jgi:hypothetical protein
MAHFLLNKRGDAGNSDLCILDKFVEGIEIKSYMVHFGQRLGDLYPKDARIRMTEDRTGLKLSSLLGNTTNAFMASSALRAVVEDHCKAVDIEYLSFTIIDHRGRPFSSDYCIINPIGARDCLDHAASKTKWGKDDPNWIVGLEGYVLDREKMEGAPPIFRIQGRPTEIVLGPSLVDEIKRHKFSNIYGTRVTFSDGKE